MNFGDVNMHQGGELTLIASWKDDFSDYGMLRVDVKRDLIIIDNAVVSLAYIRRLKLI